MGGYQRIKRTDCFAFGFQECPYFPVAYNQVFAVERKYGQGQQEFIKGILIYILFLAFLNSKLQLCVCYRRNREFMHRVLFKFPQNLLWLFIDDVYADICVQKVFHWNMGSRF